MGLGAGSNVANINRRESESLSRSYSGSCISLPSIAEPKPETLAEPCLVSCTTFNILAPIYKRLDQQNQSLRESDYRAFWVARNQRILDWLLCESSAIICLQEFWVGNEEFVNMYLDWLGDAGYTTFKLARTNNRGDGLPVTDDQLSVFSLHFLFGKNLERATRIVDQRGVKRVLGEPSGRSIFQVVGESQRKEEYLCFAEQYCACYSFFYDIVNRGEQLCCKHQLAARLAASLGACIEVKVSDEQLALLLSKL